MISKTGVVTTWAIHCGKLESDGHKNGWESTHLVNGDMASRRSPKIPSVVFCMSRDEDDHGFESQPDKKLVR
jgi:hypothetical protein